MNNNLIKYSAALCTFNGEKYLAKQLDSIINQTILVDEIIISDDGSTDNTIAILEEYYNKYPQLIKLNYNSINCGYVKNFEKAIDLCNGSVIFLSDQDDIWASNKVERFIYHINENPTKKCFVSNMNLINENEKLLNKDFWNEISFNKNNNLLDHFIKFNNFAAGASMVITHDLKKLIPFKVTKVFAHDALIILNVIINDEIVLIDECLTNYRIHDQQNIGISSFNKTPKHTVNLRAQNLNFYFIAYKRTIEINKLGYNIDVYDYFYLFNHSKRDYLNDLPLFKKILVKLKWFLNNPFKINFH